VPLIANVVVPVKPVPLAVHERETVVAPVVPQVTLKARPATMVAGLRETVIVGGAGATLTATFVLAVPNHSIGSCPMRHWKLYVP
jgi:hypothetical protein